MAKKIYAVVWVYADYTSNCHITADYREANSIIRQLEITSIEAPEVVMTVALYSAPVAIEASSRLGVKWPWRWFEKNPAD